MSGGFKILIHQTVKQRLRFINCFLHKGFLFLDFLDGFGELNPTTAPAKADAVPLPLAREACEESSGSPPC